MIHFFLYSAECTHLHSGEVVNVLETHYLLRYAGTHIIVPWQLLSTSRWKRQEDVLEKRNGLTDDCERQYYENCIYNHTRIMDSFSQETYQPVRVECSALYRRYLCLDTRVRALQRSRIHSTRWRNIDILYGTFDFLIRPAIKEYRKQSNKKANSGARWLGNTGVCIGVAGRIQGGLVRGKFACVIHPCMFEYVCFVLCASLSFARKALRNRHRCGRHRRSRYHCWSCAIVRGRCGQSPW